jgi:hypothetical protein
MFRISSDKRKGHRSVPAFKLRIGLDELIRKRLFPMNDELIRKRLFPMNNELLHLATTGRNYSATTCSPSPSLFDLDLEFFSGVKRVCQIPSRNEEKFEPLIYQILQEQTCSFGLV